ncbi:histidine kinase, partial [Streptomyces phaeofaciens]
LRSGRKHRVRGQVLWSKGGDKVSVDLTTAPVRDGDQLVGAVMTFTDRRPYDSLAEEKDSVEQRHAEELDQLSEEHASDLTALRQKHVTELEELREQQEEEVAAAEERYAALGEREKDRYDALAGRYDQLLTLLATSLRGPLDELRRELAALAADDAGQLWPEANQVLHHLSAGYSRITTLIDNVLGYQRLDTGGEAISRTKVMLDAVVAAGVDGAVELIGPGRVQFAVHAPPIEAEVDARLLATALAHLVADVAGVDATGNAPVSAGGYMDNTVVVAAAQRGEVVRIEVRGPYAGGDPVHEPIVRGIVRAHGGVLQTHEVPGMSGSAFVLEVPLGGGAGAVAAPAPAALPVLAGGTADAALAGNGEAAAEQGSGAGRRRARRSSVDAFLDGEVPGTAEGGDGEGAVPTGRRRRRGTAAEETPAELPEGVVEDGASGGTGRRRGRPAEGADADPGAGSDSGEGAAEGVSEGAVMTAAEHAAGTAASGTGLGGTVPPQGVPAPPAGRRARRTADEPQPQQHALPPALPALASAPADTGQAPGQAVQADEGQPTGRRRRALAAASERAAAQEAGPRAVFALPPAEADRSSTESSAAAADPVPAQPQPQPALQIPAQAQAPVSPQPVAGALPVPGRPAPAQVAVAGPSDDALIDHGRHDAVAPGPSDDHTPPQPHPTTAPTGRRRRAVAAPQEAAGAAGVPVTVPAQAQAHAPAPAPDAVGQPLALPGSATPAGQPLPGQPLPGQPLPGQPLPGQPLPGQPVPALPALAQPVPAPVPGTPLPQGQPLPAEAAPAAPAAPTVSAQGTPVPPNALPAAAAPAPAPVSPTSTPSTGTPLPPEAAVAVPRVAQPLPAEAAAAAPMDPHSTQGRAISVRTLGQGVPFTRQAAQVQQAQSQAQATATPAPHAPGGSGRRRKLGTPPDPAARPEQAARPHPSAEQPAVAPQTPGAAPQAPLPPQPSLAGQARLVPGGSNTEGAGRSYAIGAPDENAAEGPEPLDGPGGAVEVADPPRPVPMDDELPPEPLDNPRRLLVWPAPDVSTQQALSDRGYRPVIVHSREEVDAQIAAFPAALFVDPLTGPITRTAL